ncbi:MAG: DUF72 domain-containing protein [Phycisphaerae bacterium]|nr:DUF72 domain-containing protein [Phycisphaerae bacterium]
MTPKCDILIGTSGYSYRDWVGPIYPEGTPQSEYLRLYTQMFPTVELNFSFYRQPEPAMLERMLQTSQGKLGFAVKAFREMTHEVSPDRFQAVADQFRHGIRPLEQAGKLEAVLLQFPYSFHYTRDNREYLARLTDRLAGLPLAVEFRNSEWFHRRVFDGLRKFNLSLVSVDEPRLPKLPPPVEEVTAPLAYVRMHGRNAEKWWDGDNQSRYDYLYNDDELHEWLGRLAAMAEKASRMLVFFNNHWRGQAAQNAKRLMEMINPS